MEANGVPVAEFSLDFQYSGRKKKALQGVTGRVEPGRCVVLCGSSGCGKSTLLRCLNQLIPQFYEGTLTGFCRLEGRDTASLSIGRAGRLAGSVFQDPRSQFFTLRSDTEVAFGLENFGFPQEEIHRRVEAAFRDSGLEWLRGKEVFKLSAGQRQLAAILAAGALDTRLYLLDEPTANLDYTAVDRLARQLRRLKAAGKTLLISEHRLYYLRDIADEFWLMEEGRVVRRMTREEAAAMPPEEWAGCGLRPMDLGTVPWQPPAAAVPGCSHTLQAEDVVWSYKRGRPVLCSLDMEAKTGEIVGLIGKNGCGKTTLGKLMTGLYRPAAGRFRLDGRVLKPRALARQAVFIMQEAEFQFFTNSVLNELCYGRERTPAFMETAEQLLKRVGLWGCRNRHPFSLSGGQMQKLVLLLAYISPKPIAVLDEPTAGLDKHSLDDCAALIREMGQQKLVVVISHDVELIGQTCTRAVGMENGKICREFHPDRAGDFEALRQMLETPSETDPAPEPEKTGFLFDPRPKLLLFLAALMAGIGTHSPLILGMFGLLLAVLAAERHGGTALTGLALMGSLYGLYAWLPGVATAFLISFFPRVLLLAFAAMLLVRQEEAPRTLAALRKLHLPEKFIMVCAVTFRFFPVLQKDIGMMNQSVKTRGFFPTLGAKLRAAPAYLEMLTVPMVFRVIRIAEALSASAETRGISLPGKRDSFICLKLRWMDYGLCIVTAAVAAVGLFWR